MNNYFRYSNDSCPICGNVFTPADDIVVCPLCGTPHHRACYNKNGACANEERHNDGFHWTSSAEAPGNTNPFAPEAERPVQEGSPFIPFAPVQNPFQAFPQNIEDDIPTLESAAFIQSGGFKYTQKFFYEKSGKRTFNWAAFLFFPYWFFFRKMYELGVIFAALMLLLSCTAFIPAVSSFYKQYYDVVMQYSDVSSPEELNSFYSDCAKVVSDNKLGVAIMTAESIVMLSLRIVSGFIANKSYYKHTVRKIREIHKGAQTPDLARMRIQKEGGVSALAPLALFAVINLFDWFTSMLQTIILK
ncbi:MAG: DUF2628 domain-containing protein [Clostridiales bacterium]|nr:DUF2628 domain-containing protein [Clostridiales bacterium]